MPVTARLSKLFYDRLGEEIAQEMVDWFNQVDATYRTDLRELNELNFARFDAKLEQRVTTLEAKLAQRVTTLEAKLEQRIAALDAKLEQRLSEIDARLSARIDGVETRLAAGLNERLAGMEATLERHLGEQTRWLFVAWASLLIPVIGLWMRP
jgi:DNA anti-recombination protein RmuC